MSLHQIVPLSQFDRVVVMTGAGVSAASGTPTFRGLSGLYADVDLERALHAGALPASLPIVWGVWAAIDQAAAAGGPNPAHHALAAAQQSVTSRGGQFTLITQNVDGLHEAAGSTGVLNLHGNPNQGRCLQDSCAAVLTLTEPIDPHDPPPCPACGGALRPDIVLFGEALPELAMQQAVDAAGQAELFLSVGTSAAVWPANQLSEIAAAAGAVTASITLEEPELATRRFDHVLLEPCELALPAWARS